MFRIIWNTETHEHYPHIIQHKDLILYDDFGGGSDAILLIAYIEQYFTEWKKEPFEMVIDYEKIIKEIKCPILDIKRDVSKLSNQAIGLEIKKIIDKIIEKITFNLNHSKSLFTCDNKL